MILHWDRIEYSTPPKCTEETEKKHSITLGTHFVDGDPTWYYRLNGTLDPDLGKQYIIDKGFLRVDRGVGRYVAFSATIPIPHKHFYHAQLWKYRIIPFRDAKVGFIVMSRSACSCLLATSAKANGVKKNIKDNYPEPASAWCQGFPLAQDSMEHLEDFTLAFVYNPPFDKWCNSCNYFEGINANKIGEHYAPNKKLPETKEGKMYSFLIKCELESKFDYYNKDQHLMGQIETIGLCPREPDLVVPINYLSDYLRKEIGIEPVKANVETNWWFNPAKDVPKEIQDRVNNLYDEDYDIPTLFKDKMYEP